MCSGLCSPSSMANLEAKSWRESKGMCDLEEPARRDFDLYALGLFPVDSGYDFRTNMNISDVEKKTIRY